MSTKVVKRSDSDIFAPNSTGHCSKLRVSSLGHPLSNPSSSTVASRILENTHALPDQLPSNVTKKLSNLSLAESRYYLTRSDPGEHLSLHFNEIEDEEEKAIESPKVRQISPALSETSTSDSEEVVLTKNELQKQEFHKLPTSPSKPYLFPDLFATALVDMERNRYPDILALEATRFCIAEEPLFYFNANWVLDRSAIATQGPLENEHAEFWKMVWHANPCLIVMLVNLEEQGKTKCSHYWPAEQPMKFEEGAFTISFQSAATDKNSVKRQFLLERKGEKRTLTQSHITYWPDKGVIDKKDLAELILEVDRTRSQHPGLPILAHCSAGIGRTGTFFAVLEGFDRLKKGKDNPTLVFDIVSALRNERVFMVQMPEQYVLIYETLEYLKAYLEGLK